MNTAAAQVMVWSYHEGSRMPKHYKLKDVQKWQKAKMKQETDPRFDKDAPKLLSFHWYPVQMGYEGDEEADRLGDGDDYHSTLASAKVRWNASHRGHRVDPLLQPLSHMHVLRQQPL